MKIALFLLSLTLFASTAVLAQDHKADEMKIIGMENLWNAAVRDHDNKAMQAILAETFIDTEPDGNFMNKSEFLAFVKDPSVTHTLLANSDMKVTYYAHSAVVSGNYHDKGTDKGKPFELHARFTDTWVESDGKWLCVSSASTPILAK